VTSLTAGGGEFEKIEKWSISLDTWEKFNVTCIAVHKFSFGLIPFGDPFFEVQVREALADVAVVVGQFHLQLPTVLPGLRYC
jgi:hypothetical protein